MSNTGQELALRNQHTDVVVHESSRVLDFPKQSYSMVMRRFQKLHANVIDIDTITELVDSAVSECRENAQGADSAYDFCLIHSEYDVEMAEEIKTSLIKQLHLKGCTIGDVAVMGEHIFTTYERMIDSSYKVLFLLTPRFNKDKFQMKIQNSAVFQSLIDKAGDKNAHLKCVPVILETSIGTIMDIPCRLL